MLNTFDKTKAHEARRAAIQRQMEAMEVAASSRNVGGTSTLVGGQSVMARKRGGTDTAAPAGSLETARRFLWDEDEEDDPYATSQMTGAGASGIASGTSAGRTHRNTNIAATAAPTDPGHGGLFGIFRSNTSHNKKRQRHFNTIMTEMGDGKGPCAFLGRLLSGCCLSIAGCLTWFRTRLAMACGNGRGLRCLMLMALVLLIVVPIAIFLPKNSSRVVRTGSSGATSKVSDAARYEAISKRIIDDGITTKKTLLTAGTAQNQALLWIANEDPARMAPTANFLLERYSLAVFYYSTHGDNMFQTTIVNTTITSDGKEELQTTGGTSSGETESGISLEAPAEGEVTAFGDDLAGQPNWLNEQYWLSGSGYCNWHGVQCHHRPGTSNLQTRYDGNNGIILLNMTENNVRGTIPPEIFRMNQDMRFLALSSNGFFGKVPTELSQLKELRKSFARLALSSLCRFLPMHWTFALSNLFAQRFASILIHSLMPFLTSTNGLALVASGVSWLTHALLALCHSRLPFCCQQLLHGDPSQ